MLNSILSFKEGKPIARVVGGPYDKNILFVKEDSEYNNYEKEDKKGGCNTCGGSKESCKDGCNNCGDKCENIENIKIYTELEKLIDKVPDGKLLEFYDIVTHAFKKHGIKHRNDYIGKEFKCENKCELIPIPDPNKRECLYICGQSGSGKSYYSAMYIKEFKKIFPEKKIYLFSRVDEDDVLDSINPIRVKLDDSLIEDPIHPSQLEQSLCIFDDIDTIPDSKIKKAVCNLVDDILEIGRHHNIYVIRISHLINNYKETRKVLNECTSLTLFPGGSSQYAIKYVLQHYFGMEKEQITKFLKLPSRWITIHKNYPTTILYKHGAYILN